MKSTIAEARARGCSSIPNQGDYLENNGAEVGPGRSFLLRMWSPSEWRNLVWQASLEDPHTGERIGFASLEHLFAYLIELSEEVAR